MSWTAAVYCGVILVLAFALLAYYVWPRHRNGKLYSIEEFEEFLDNLPPSPKTLLDRTRWVVCAVFGTLAMIGYALTHRGHSRYHDHDD